MLLNEVQKQYRRAEAEAEVVKVQQQRIDTQQQEIEVLQKRLSRLESLLEAKATVASKRSE